MKNCNYFVENGCKLYFVFLYFSMIKSGSNDVSHVVIDIDFVISGPGRKNEGPALICINCLSTSMGRIVQATMLKFTQYVEINMTESREKNHCQRSKVKVKVIK